MPFRAGSSYGPAGDGWQDGAAPATDRQRETSPGSGQPPLKPLEAFGMREFFSRSPPRPLHGGGHSPIGGQRSWFDEGSSFFGGAQTSTGGKSITDDVETLDDEFDRRTAGQDL